MSILLEKIRFSIFAIISIPNNNYGQSSGLIEAITSFWRTKPFHPFGSSEIQLVVTAMDGVEEKPVAKLRVVMATLV